MFKALKSCLRADQLPTSNKTVAEVLVWAALLRFVLSQLTLLTIRQLKGTTAKRMPVLRWQRLFEEMSDELLMDLVKPRVPTSLLDWIVHYAQDPNSRQREFALHLLAKLAPVDLQPS